MRFDFAYMFSMFAMPAVWRAALVVVELSALSWLSSVVLGFGLAWARMSPSWWLARPAAIYIWFFRSVPLIVLIIFVYNLPQLFPATGVALSHPFFSGFVALLLTETAYMAELHRGGLMSVGKGQYEAATALGLRPVGIQRLVVIPQALRIALPSLVNQYIACVKLTALVSVISLRELLLLAEQLYAQNLLVMESLLAITVFYVGIVTFFSWIMTAIERRLDLSRRKAETLPADRLAAIRASLPAAAAGQGAGRQQADVSALLLNGLRKCYGSHEVLKGIDLAVKAGEVISIIGPSGSGKTSLIRTINALETIDQGEIILFGQSYILASDPPRNPQVSRGMRRIGMVFQGFNLFPHRTILDNVILAPCYHGAGRAAATSRALALLDKVGLLAHAYKYPHQLSGGQQQRVAIARALAMEPEIMLFDEPTSALDPELVGEVLKVIAQLAQEGMTMLIVTHEMDFAMSISDRVVFMENGVVQLAAAPAEIRERPDAERVRRFVGLPAQAVQDPVVLQTAA
ncbi:MAG TPA: amino acid ABC transporter permease/ATP-binding protein [Bordetella sp.]